MKHAVLLMAYGSPTKMEDVMEYLQGIYEGGSVPQYAVEENTRKYRMFGGRSPSNGIVERVASKLSALLENEGDYRVFLGNKHWKPTLDDAVSGISAFNPDDIIAIPLFPFPSENVEKSYSIPLGEVLENHGIGAPMSIINGFFDDPLFTKAWDEVLRKYVSDFPPDTMYIFSAHSLPTMRSEEELYRKTFFEVSTKLAQVLGIKSYRSAFQSRGKYGSSWLEPSVEETFLSSIGEMGNTLVAIPLGFIYDHLEILYDLDFEFGNLVKSNGKEYHRSSLPNDSDSFVQCLKSVVMKATSRNK